MKTRSNLKILPALLGLALGATTAWGQAISTPNQIRGQIGFTNTDPDIVDLLTSEGFSVGAVTASSMAVNPTLSSSTNVTVTHPMEASYELTVETGNATANLPFGIAYEVRPDLRLDGGKDRYFFAPQVSGPVQGEPHPDVVLDFLECAGLVDVRWVDALGHPAPVTSATINAFRETESGSGDFEEQATSGIASPTSQESLAVRGDGSLYEVEILFASGADPSSDLLRFLHVASLTAQCDERIEIVIEIPTGSSDLGRIIGRVDMLGENEVAPTRIWADDGPFSNLRSDLVAAPHSFSDFELENLPASSLTSPPTGYRLYGEALRFRTDRRYEFFATPLLEANNTNPRVFVDAGETVDVGDLFVFDPGYVSGDIRLAGPPADAGQFGSCLEDVFRASDRDFNNDGVPDDNVLVTSSRLEGYGQNVPGPGASWTAYRGLARVLFDGEFNPATSDFEGDVDLVLGGLDGESSVWRTSTFFLNLVDAATPQQPASYQFSRMALTDNILADHVIVPGATVEQPIHYCFSQVNVAFSSATGTFFEPRLELTGSYSGIDFEGVEADYTVGQASVLGTPTNPGTADNEGLVVSCLPQGSYNAKPFIRSLTPGGISTTELPPLNFSVGCRQIVNIVPELQLSLGTLPACVATPQVEITGAVDSVAGVSHITAAANGNETTFCTACGVDPSFAFAIPLEACDNDLLITAEDGLERLASVTTTVRRDGTAPELTCADVSVPLPSGADGAVVDFAAGGHDVCDGGVPVSCDHPSGTFFLEGDTLVTCSASDTCGNSSSCTFTVSVGETGGDCTEVYGVNDLGLNDSQFFRLDPATHAVTPFGPVHPAANLESIALHPTTGDLYAIASGNAGATSGTLYRADKKTGALTPIGNTGATTLQNSIAAASFHPDGSLWVFRKNKGLYTLDLGTAGMTLKWPVPNPGGDVRRKWDALAWNPAGTLVYGAQEDELYVWDPVSRQAQRLCGAGFLPFKTEALEFDLEGNLMAGSGGTYFRLDPASCQLQVVVDLPELEDIESLAFASCSP